MAAGVTTLAGKLGDGTAATFSGFVSKQGTWAYYQPLYTNSGCVAGEMRFADLPRSDSSGLLYWVKPANSKDKFFWAGFETSPTMIVQRYTSPAKGARMLSNWDASLGKGRLLVMEEAAGPGAFRRQFVIWTLSNTIVWDEFLIPQTGPGAMVTTLNLRPTATTGLIGGSFFYPGNWFTSPVSATCLQKSGECLGFFPALNEWTDAIKLEPTVP